MKARKSTAQTLPVLFDDNLDATPEMIFRILKKEIVKRGLDDVLRETSAHLANHFRLQTWARKMKFTESV